MVGRNSNPNLLSMYTEKEMEEIEQERKIMTIDFNNQMHETDTRICFDPGQIVRIYYNFPTYH